MTFLKTMLHFDGIGDDVDLRRVQVRMKYTKLMNTADPPPSRFRLFAEDLLWPPTYIAGPIPFRIRGRACVAAQLTASTRAPHSLVSHKIFFFFGATAPQWARASSFTRFLDHTQRCTTVDMNPLDGWSAWRSDVYLTTHNSHNRHPRRWWDSNQQSQQASGRRRTPLTARTLGPAAMYLTIRNILRLYLSKML